MAQPLQRPDLTADQQTLVQTIYDALREHLRWPSSRRMRVRFREKFEVQDVAQSTPLGILAVDDASQQGGTCRLGLRALFYCHGSDDDRRAAALYIRQLGRSYVSDGPDDVLVEELRVALNLDVSTMRRVLMLTQYEAMLTRGSTQNSEGVTERVTVSHDAMPLERVETLEDYFAIRDDHYAKLEERRARSWGGPVDTRATVPTASERHRNLRLDLERVRNILLAGATGQSADNAAYTQLRTDLLAATELQAVMPELLVTGGSVAEVVAQLKAEGTSYARRREVIANSFSPAIRSLVAEVTPHARGVDDAIRDLVGVREAWEKAVQRQAADPTGAITSARTLLEATLRHALSELSVSHSTSEDLPALYRLFKKAIAVRPLSGAEQAIVQILSGSQSIVEGMARLRNEMGDAHAGASSHIVPPHYAELAVNIAGTMALFIVKAVESPADTD